MSVNKIFLLGRLGQTPELRATEGKKAICWFSVATDSYDRKETYWHRVVTFDKLAESCAKYLDKGKQVWIEGSVVPSKWKNKDGVEQRGYEVRAFKVQFLGATEQKQESKQAGFVDHTTQSFDSPAPFDEHDEIPF